MDHLMENGVFGHYSAWFWWPSVCMLCEKKGGITLIVLVMDLMCFLPRLEFCAGGPWGLGAAVGATWSQLQKMCMHWCAQTTPEKKQLAHFPTKSIF